MNCAEARLCIGAAPGASDAALEAHLATCAACRRFREEMRGLETHIVRALELGPPQRTRRPRSAAPVWRQWALAASVALVAFALLGVWALRPSDALARDVVRHVQGEPDSWFATQHLTAPEIDAALRGAGVDLGITTDRIVYAHSCFFRGHYVPHLVVETASGPVTVLVLRHEAGGTRRTFREAGMSGEIVPVGTGSIAVVARGSGDIAPIAAQIGKAVRWTPGGT